MSHPSLSNSPAERLSPLFTTTPLLRSSFEHPLSISPLDTQHGHYEYRESTPDEDAANVMDFAAFKQPSQYPTTLTFEKVPIQPLSQQSHDHTRSSTTSESGSGISAGPSRSSTRSPSLITCLFQSNRTRNDSSSGSSQPTPTTPLSFSPPASQGCRPILRRPTGAATTSASTSMTSDDNGNGFYGVGFGGLGLTCLDKVVEQGKGNFNDNEADRCESEKRRHCSLKFDVKPCAPLTTGRRVTVPATPSHDIRYARRLAPTQTSAGRAAFTPEPEPMETEHSSCDEGYEEDEEGGFTSDEDAVETLFAEPRRARAWNAQFSQAVVRPNPDETGSAPFRGRAPVETYSTTDDNEPVPCRGRKISIAAKMSDTCSRHRSPPPPTPGLDSLSSYAVPSPMPPAARSPSAADLCRRRQSKGGGGVGVGLCSRNRKEGNGWRTEGSFFPSRTSTRTRSAHPAPSTANLNPDPQGVKCTPILLPSRPVSGDTTPIDLAPTPKALPRYRTGSLPAPSSLWCKTPLGGQCKLDDLHAVAEAASTGTRQGAQEGLRAALAVCK